MPPAKKSSYGPFLVIGWIVTLIIILKAPSLGIPAVLLFFGGVAFFGLSDIRRLQPQRYRPMAWCYGLLLGTIALSLLFPYPWVIFPLAIACIVVVTTLIARTLR